MSANAATDIHSEAEEQHVQTAIIGCLLGTAVGDALGLSCEGLSKQRQRRMFPDIARYHLLFGRGMVSDDTEHAWMTAQALLVSGGVPNIFIRSFAWQLRLWLVCLPAGVGFATLRAALRLWFGWSPERSGVYSAGNGPAMRSALLGVCYGHDPERLKALVRLSTRITHTDPKAEWGALAIAVAGHLAAEHGREKSPDAQEKADLPKESSAEWVNACCRQITTALPDGSEEFAALLEQARASVQRGETTEAFASSLGLAQGVSGYVYHTVPAALHAWLRHPNDYEQAVLDVIRCGGDTDTTGAIVGALVGATVGREGIRADWRQGLWEWPRTIARMEQTGRLLAASCLSGRPHAAVRVNPLAVIARNLLFLMVVLLHGFRRLLPPY